MKSSGLRTSIQSHQTKMRELNVKVNGTAGTPVASGFDGLGIKEVIDVGTGEYTLVLLRPFNVNNANDPMAWVQSLTAGITARVKAVDFDRVTVECQNAAGTATDADLLIKITGCDNRFNYR